MTKYTNLYDITELQQKIILYVGYWVRTEKTPVPQKEIMIELKNKGEKERSIEYALAGLLKQGYLRRAIGTSNKVRYVQLRSI